MKILAISDVESKAYWDFYRPGMLDEFDLILSAGDLDPKYLEFLVTMAKCPLYYVHGNHDGRYAETPPEGCECIEDRVVEFGGLRILGLGGSHRYNGGPHQYTQKEMRQRLQKTRLQQKMAGGVDILLTHAPAKGFGDGEDPCHEGFDCFWEFLSAKKPRVFIHGHVHPDGVKRTPRKMIIENTMIINAYERFLLDLEMPGD